MKWFAGFILLLLGFIFDAHALTISELLMTEYESLIKNSDLNVQLKIRQGGGTFSTPGFVNVDVIQVQQVLSNIENEALMRQSIRFILAHELWHIRQFKLYGNDIFQRSADEVRLYECQADVAGGLTILSSLKGGKSLPDFLRQVANLAYSVGIPDEPGGRHPTSEQRRTSVKFGFTYAAATDGFLPSLKSELGDEGARKFQDGLAHSIGLKPNEDFEKWSLRECRLIIHLDSAAVQAVVLRQASIVYNHDPNSPFVHFDIPYVNISTRPILLNIVVQSVAISRSSPNDVSKQVVYAVLPVEFELPPGGEQHIIGTLPWYGTTEFMPRLEYRPESIHSLMSASFTAEPKSAEESCLSFDYAGGATLPRQLSHVLTQIALAARSNLSSLKRGAGTDYGDSVDFDSNLQIPGATDTSISFEKSGATSISGMIFDGGNDAQAEKVYESYKDALRAICPVGTKFSESSGPIGPEFDLKYSRDAEVRLYIYRNKKKGNSDVNFVVDMTKW